MNDEIYIGMFPPEGHDWRALMAAILGRDQHHEGTPYIDSRLHAVRSKTAMEEGNILGNRVKLWVNNEESYATLLYRLAELYDYPPHLSLDVIDAGQSLLSDLLEHDLKLEPDVEYLLLDTPPVLICHECSSKPPDLEEQDQVYVCHKCGWTVNYQSEWPYVCKFVYDISPYWVTLGTIKAVVSRQLATREVEHEG